MGQDWIWVWRLALARSLLLAGNDLWQTAFLGTHTQGTHPIFYLLGIRRDKTYAILCWRSSLVHRNYRDCYDYLEQHHQLAPRPFNVIGVEVAVQLKVGVLHLSLDIPEDSKQLFFFTKPGKNRSQECTCSDCKACVV